MICLHVDAGRTAFSNIRATQLQAIPLEKPLKTRQKLLTTLLCDKEIPDQTLECVQEATLLKTSFIATLPENPNVCDPMCKIETLKPWICLTTSKVSFDLLCLN